MEKSRSGKCIFTDEKEMEGGCPGPGPRIPGSQDHCPSANDAENEGRQGNRIITVNFAARAARPHPKPASHRIASVRHASLNPIETDARQDG